MRIPGLLLCGIAPLLAACGDTCRDVEVPNPERCRLATYAAGTPLLFEVREGCGSTCDGPPRCEAEVRGDVLSLTVWQERCDAAGDCNAMCATRLAPCQVPALAAGTWNLSINGAPRGTFEVAEGEVETRCAL